METLVIVAASVAGLLHIGFWILESLLWRRPAVHRIFGVRDLDLAAVQRPVFFNLGFYNLFLGLGAIAGAWLYANDHGSVLLVFTMLFMLGAAIVLVARSRALWRGALVQAGPALVALLALLATPASAADVTPDPAASDVPQVTASTTPSPADPSAPGIIGGVSDVTIVSQEELVTGLEIPWALAFMPDGSLLVTERQNARILRIVDGVVTPLTGPGADAVAASSGDKGEGGLLGLAVLPQTDDPSGPAFIYVYQTLETGNAVLRMTLEGDTLSEPIEILGGIPASGNHNGGRIKFGPDGYLYVATGDAAEGSSSQDQDSLAGKILRIVADGTDADGSPAPGNPLGNEIWTYGHRNVQGLAWVADGRMYASEFGSEDVDELNLIEPGLNYGWPILEGLDRAPQGTELGQTVEGLTYPWVEWRPTSSNSPSGIAITDEGVYIAGLRGESLFRVPLTADAVGESQVLIDDLGRLRDVVVGPDGALYLITNNTDGRGEPRDGDDRLIRIEVAPAS